MAAYTISTTNDNRKKDGSQMQDFKHNLRDPEAVRQANQYDIDNGREPHIKVELSPLNEYWKAESLEEAYERIFGDAVREYNAKQKRKDRHTSIEKEMQKIKDTITSKNPQYLCYEMISQIGDQNNHPDEELCKIILKEFVEKWEKEYSNLKIFQCSLHMDEATPHIHIDYIPVAFQNKRGLKVQNGLRRAFEEMGFTNQNIMEENEQGELIDTGVFDHEGGAKAQWIADCNQMLEDICVEHGLEIIHPMAGKKLIRMQVDEYKSMKEELEKNREELVEVKAELETEKTKNTELKKENKLEQRKNIQLANENSNLRKENEVQSMEINEVKNELQEVKTELQQAYHTRDVLEQKCEEMHNEYIQMRDAKSKLQNDINSIIEENQMSDADIKEISDGMQNALVFAVKKGKVIGANGMTGNEAAMAENEVITHGMDMVMEPMQKLQKHHRTLVDKIRSTIETWKTNLETAKILNSGGIPVFTGKDGRVSEQGKSYIERQIRARLSEHDHDEAWEPMREHYRTLTDADKEMLIERLKRKSVDYAEDSCSEKPTTKYIHKSKLNSFVDCSADSVGKSIMTALQQIKQMEEQYLDELER